MTNGARTKADAAALKAAIRKEMQSGLTFGEAAVKVEAAQPDAYRRVIGEPPNG